MKDYSAMSDLEINAQVSRELYGPVSRGHQMELASGTVDYCNNPADAWPIITENKLHLTTEEDGIWSSRGYSDKHAPIDVDHANPLRAAMTVYLMMKDAEKCDG